jgi:hypothetical protein
MERGSPSGRPGSACPSDSVHVVLQRLWQVHVDHVGHAADVQPSGGDIGCYLQETTVSLTDFYDRSLIQSLLNLPQPTDQCHVEESFRLFLLDRSLGIRKTAGRHQSLSASDKHSALK